MVLRTFALTNMELHERIVRTLKFIRYKTNFNASKNVQAFCLLNMYIPENNEYLQLQTIWARD